MAVPPIPMTGRAATTPRRRPSPRSTEARPSRIRPRPRRTRRPRRASALSGPRPRPRRRPAARRSPSNPWRLWTEARPNLRRPAEPMPTTGRVSTEARPSRTCPTPRAPGTALAPARLACRPWRKSTEGRPSLPRRAEPTPTAGLVSTEAQQNLLHRTTPILRCRTCRRWRCSAEPGTIAIRSCELCARNPNGGYRVRTRANTSTTFVARQPKRTSALCTFTRVRSPS